MAGHLGSLGLHALPEGGLEVIASLPAPFNAPPSWKLIPSQPPEPEAPTGKVLPNCQGPRSLPVHPSMAICPTATPEPCSPNRFLSATHRSATGQTPVPSLALPDPSIMTEQSSTANAKKALRYGTGYCLEAKSRKAPKMEQLSR